MDATPEQWRPIPGYEGFYEVSDQGRIKSLARKFVRANGRPHSVRERIRKPGTLRSGHKTVQLCMRGSDQTHSVHRLVMLAFVGPCPNGMEVCHNNSIPADNRLTNLRYDTNRSNQLDRLGYTNHRNIRKTHCLRGHPFDSENTWVNEKRNSSRRCKECSRARCREYKRRRKAVKSQTTP